jgi:pimeloyl-ACP methyl ester carboxylesterase
MAEGTVAANGITLWYETFGDPADPALVLIMGLGGQGIHWPTAFCRRLAVGGRYVIRFDNRDVGRSSWFDEAATYTREDMADDVVGLLDALGIQQAHIVGISMGGAIAQWTAVRHPQRTLSLISMMEEPYTPAEETAEQAAGRLVEPTAPLAELLSGPAPATREGRIGRQVELWRTIWGTVPFDEAEMRALEAEAYDRAYRPQAARLHMAANHRTPSRVEALRRLTVPTLVIHGTADTLIPPDRGAATAALIPGAKLVLINGMGHSLPRACWDQLVTTILQHTA